MVYDEGLEFHLGLRDSKNYGNFFSFLKYSLNDNKKLPDVNSKYYSHCYQTLIGWYHTHDNRWGCFFGNKEVPNFSDPTNGEAPKKQIVLQNSVEPAFLEKHLQENPKDISSSSSKHIPDNYSNNKSFLQTGLIMNLQSETVNKENSNTNTLEFLELNSEFKNHEEVVSRINSMNLSWKAKVHNKMKDKTIGQLNKMSGQKSKESHNSHNLSFNINDSNNVDQNIIENKSNKYSKEKIKSRIYIYYQALLPFP